MNQCFIHKNRTTEKQSIKIVRKMNLINPYIQPWLLASINGVSGIGGVTSMIGIAGVAGISGVGGDVKWRCKVSMYLPGSPAHI